MVLIDRSAAHRSTRSESLVWAIEAVSPTDWRADVEIPRSHWLCHPTPDRVPVTLLAEAFRQAGLAICVAGLGMGQSMHFIVSSMTVRVEPENLRFPRFGALEGTLEVHFAGITQRKGIPHVLEVEYNLPGIASGRVDARVLVDRDYRAIRRNAAELDACVRPFGGDLIETVARSGDQLAARLGVDESDPFFFDHPVDHLPGMLLLHSAAVMHEREHGAPPRFLTVSFPAFGELRADTDISATVTPRGIDAAFTQGGRLIASALTDEHTGAWPESLETKEPGPAASKISTADGPGADPGRSDQHPVPGP
ncbi:AfsA-related hotdog domain-containing protein [Gryllotalpicola koreensis]|uniref:ScbA/BarX family gamma-butyrolactone biosynthesis protein n=1 Tax=Gryllotalpicola koreensis TaxID=993086 RepID=A0ABP7ZPA9_9MICO